jgi:hypothetical protein
MGDVLPALDRFALAVAHLPGAADADRAGSGWYDVTAIADGHLAIVAGDVGAAPTSVAGQLCRVVAGLGSERRSPAVALEALDGAARGIPGSLPRGIGGRRAGGEGPAAHPTRNCPALLDTGMHVSELTGVRLTDVDFTTRHDQRPRQRPTLPSCAVRPEAGAGSRPIHPALSTPSQSGL